MLNRILEPEVMDSDDDAREYDAMDHAHVNQLFVADLLAALTDWSLQRPISPAPGPLTILDLGAGTAQIPIELARRNPTFHIIALDAAASMLAVAEQNIAAAQLVPFPFREGPEEGSSTAFLSDRIELFHADAKDLQSNSFSDAKARRSGARPLAANTIPVVISNSILHHIPEPRAVIAEAIRVTSLGGLLFHRDLCRPDDQAELDHIVETYAADANAYQRKLFADSLHAALTVEEVQQLIAPFGFAPGIVCKTSDRHWTWCASKP